MNTESTASKFAAEVMRRPHLQHAAVRLGLWLVGVAEQQGGFPVVVNIGGIQHGLVAPGVEAPGVNFRSETIANSIASLEAEGLLHVERPDSHKQPRRFTLTLD